MSVLATAEGFGLRLKRMRQEKDWTATELSKRSGVSKASICRYQQGVSYPGLWEFASLCDTLGVTPNDFLGVVPMRSKWSD